MSKPAILIGITGNYGSGKSSVCKLLREQGHEVVSADEVARAQLDHPDSLKQIAERWGKEVVKNGRANRRRVAEIVFRDRAELEWLNRLTHPKTLCELQNIADASTREYLFFEIPLLFEAGLQGCFDYLILVSAERELRLKRLRKRDKTTDEAILARMENQINDNEKIPLCNLVIDNNAGPARLRKQVDRFLASMDSIERRDKYPFCT